MKSNTLRFSILFAVSLTAASLFTGCATTTNPTTGQQVTRLDPERTANVLRAIVTPATRIAVAKQPETRQYFVAAKVAICALSDSGRVTPDDLKQAVAATGINEIQTPEIQATIESAYAVYQAYYADVLAAKLDVNEWVQPVLRALCNGLDQGLITASPSPSAEVVPVITNFKVAAYYQPQSNP